MTRPRKPCIDCVAELPDDLGPEVARKIASRRPVVGPGPRCATHWRAERVRRKQSARERHIAATYGLQPGDAAAILEIQGGTCAICQRATGATKHLSIDHDHACCPGPISCGKCVRGLLCGPCNRGVLGHLRDDPAALQRAIDYLTSPPARPVLAQRRSDLDM